MSWLHIYTFKERSYFLIITITIQCGPSKTAQKEALYITQVRGQKVASVCKLSQGAINCVRYSMLRGGIRVSSVLLSIFKMDLTLGGPMLNLLGRSSGFPCFVTRAGLL